MHELFIYIILDVMSKKNNSKLTIQRGNWIMGSSHEQKPPLWIIWSLDFITRSDFCQMFLWNDKCCKCWISMSGVFLVGGYFCCFGKVEAHRGSIHTFPNAVRPSRVSPHTSSPHLQPPHPPSKPHKGFLSCDQSASGLFRKAPAPPFAAEVTRYIQFTEADQRHF